MDVPLSRQSTEFWFEPSQYRCVGVHISLEITENDEADCNMTVPVLYSYILQSKHFYMKRLNENDKIGIPHITRGIKPPLCEWILLHLSGQQVAYKADLKVKM